MVFEVAFIETSWTILFVGTLVIMDSYSEHKLFDIKQEEDPLSVNEIKIEPQDRKCGDMKTDEKECDKFTEYINIKCEIEPISYSEPFTETTLKGFKAQVTREPADIVVKIPTSPPAQPAPQQYHAMEEMQTQNEKKNVAENESNIKFTVRNSCETYITDLEEQKFKMCDYREEKGRICRLYNSSCTAVNNSLSVSYKSFSDETILITHTNSHRNENQFTCNICNNSFKNKFELSKHKRIHSNEKSFACDICRKSFRYKSQLIQHTQMHTSDKPFTCNICSKTFRIKAHLAEHMRIHTNEKPYACSMCSRLFNRKSSLTQHIYSHTNKKQYKCNICSKAFLYKPHIFQHIKVHSKKLHTCDVCVKSFRYKSTLAEHLRTHTNEKPFICDICRTPFRKKSHLVEHKRIHTKERPFTCNKCNRSFSRKSTLTKHTLNHINKSCVQM